MRRSAEQPLLHPLFSTLVAPGVNAALATLARSGAEQRAAVFTRREVVDFILDLIGYTSDRPLAGLRLLEPSFGAGDFLLRVVERLLASNEDTSIRGAASADLFNAIRAVEIHEESYRKLRQRLGSILADRGFSKPERSELLGAWLIRNDFLLTPLSIGFDFVVGNPPYVRQELIPPPLLQEYRRRFVTLYDRADLYVPFIERSLSLLRDGGRLGFICADRWMKNRYGGPLRRMVSEGYRLKYYVDMVDTPAFHSEVTAYPAITIISKEAPGPTRIAYRPSIDSSALKSLAMHFSADKLPGEGVREVREVTTGAGPWVLDSSAEVDLLRRLEAEYPPIESAGCRVGIGVATGADGVFIGPFDELNVEPSRKLRLVMTRDIARGTVAWRGLGIVNPFDDEGGLVGLAEFPLLEAYFEEHRSTLQKRHVSKKNPGGWYRTIDRITPSLARTRKLLIPDIKGTANVVLEEGVLYPHHNLYFVTSTEWDLTALRAVLLSRVARLFVASYSTRMRGGYLRFQAQYLRRIRIPTWGSLTPAVQAALQVAGQLGDLPACDEAVFDAYQLTTSERRVMLATS